MPRSAAHDARNSAFREAFKTPFDFKTSLLPTDGLITKEAGKLQLKHETEDIPDAKGARLHWFGDRSASRVLLWYHGGGFCFPALKGHVRFWNECLISLNPENDVVVAALEYGLTPEVRYPTQVIQGLESSRSILAKGYEPSSIVIGGDSAGGNLALAIISVLLHGLDGVQPLKLDTALAGVLLFSPMVSFSTDAESWKENEDKDCVSPTTMDILKSAYVDPVNVDNFSEPLRADATWWTGLPASAILNVYGAEECFGTDIIEMGDKLAEVGNNVETVGFENSVHIDWVLDLHAGLEAETMPVKILGWLSSVLSEPKAT